MNKSIELFYDLKKMYAIPDESFNIYFELKNSINLSRNCTDNILLVFPTIAIAEREFKKARLNAEIICNTKKRLIISNHKNFTFLGIEEVRNRIHYISSERYTEVRFLG